MAPNADSTPGPIPLAIAIPPFGALLASAAAFVLVLARDRDLGQSLLRQP
jgi:hypothetical protein